VGLGLDGSGLAHDSGRGIFLLWARPSKVGLVTHLVVFSINISSIVSGISQWFSNLSIVVALGIFPDLFENRG